MSRDNREPGRCPACGSRFRLPDPSESYFLPPWSGGGIPDFEIQCTCCGHQFVVDLSADILDDGDLDDEAAFDVHEEEIDWDADPLMLRRCPRCSSTVECSGEFMLKCIHCSHAFAAHESSRTTTPSDAEESDEFSGCPNCMSDGDMDGEPMNDLGRGWLLCWQCGMKFFFESADEDAQPKPAGKVDIKMSPGARSDLPSLQSQLFGIAEADVAFDAGYFPGEFQSDVRRLMLVGSGSARTKLQGPLRFFNSSVVLRGLRIARGAKFNRCVATMDNCVIEGGVEATGSELNMKRCTVKNAKEAGIGIYLETRATLSQCIIRNSLGAGLLVETGSWARAIETRFVANREGVCVRPGNIALLRRCRMTSNREAGIRIQSGQGAIVQCTVARNGAEGIDVEKGSRVVLDRTRIVFNGRRPIRVAKPALLAKRRCVILEEQE